MRAASYMVTLDQTYFENLDISSTLNSQPITHSFTKWHMTGFIAQHGARGLNRWWRR